LSIDGKRIDKSFLVIQYVLWSYMSFNQNELVTKSSFYFIIFSERKKKRRARVTEKMHSFSIIFIIIFLSITIPIYSHNVIRGKKPRYSIYCPILNALWYGPNNQSVLTNSNKIFQLTIDHLTSFDEGEYICQNNKTNHVIKRYKLKFDRMKNVLLKFFYSNIHSNLGKKYSGINQ
jgi:hypothetical protein